MRLHPGAAETRAVLFDLDGTLLDTAEDLVAAANFALEQEQMPACDPLSVRPFISGGARSMLSHWISRIGHSKAAAEPDSERLERLIACMMDRYAQHPATFSRFFEGMETVLDQLERRGLRWGIVTNKRSYFTQRLLQALGLEARTDCVISGDTTPHAKPHPLPLLVAAERLGLEPFECLYVGDAPHDIEAGRRAGMRTLVAAYGYLAPDAEPCLWGSDGTLNRPLDLLDWLGAPA